MLLKVTRGNIFAAILLAALALPSACGEEPKPVVSTFQKDPRIAEALRLIEEAKRELIENGSYRCCCAEPCTLCLLERGVCTCADDLARNKAACGECLPRVQGADPLAAEIMKKHTIKKEDVRALEKIARSDPQSPPGIRDPTNPCWLNRQHPKIRQALILMEQIKGDLNEQSPALYGCCCKVPCNDCLLETGSCGCGDAITNAEKVAGEKGVLKRKPKACPECVRTWTLQPDLGTALFQEEDGGAIRKPRPDELQSTGAPIPHPSTKASPPPR